VSISPLYPARSDRESTTRGRRSARRRRARPDRRQQPAPRVAAIARRAPRGSRLRGTGATTARVRDDRAHPWRDSGRGARRAHLRRLAVGDHRASRNRDERRVFAPGEGGRPHPRSPDAPARRARAGLDLVDAGCHGRSRAPRRRPESRRPLSRNGLAASAAVGHRTAGSRPARHDADATTEVRDWLGSRPTSAASAVATLRPAAARRLSGSCAAALPPLRMTSRPSP
jgi:hypothetical protein